MHVLEDAARVVGNLDSQVVGHARVPGPGEILDGEAVLDQVLLQLEAQDDVHVVGDLVGIDADQRRVHLVHRPVETLLVDIPELRRECVLQTRIVETPERAATPDEVLPQAALGLMQAQ